MLLSDVQASVEVFQRDLLHHRGEMGRRWPDFEARIGRWIPSTEPLQVRELQTEAAFVIENRRFVFNYSAFKAFHRSIDQAEKSGKIDSEFALYAREMAVEQLVVHELDHVSVGLAEFRDVQDFKQFLGRDALGEIDTIADTTAARVCAHLEMCRSGETGDLQFGRRFLQQLVFMGTFAFPSFGSPADKPHKRRRFLGIAMMAARADAHLTSGRVPDVATGDLPFDTPLYPYSTDDGELLLCAFKPDRVVWGRKLRVAKLLLTETLDEIDHVDFSVSIQRAGSLLSQVGRLVIPLNDNDAASKAVTKQSQTRRPTKPA